MKKRLLAVMVAAMALSNGLTVSAAPQTMQNGTVFDAEYYAQQNPDVVAVYGTNASSLYSHYTTHGKSEGRKSHANDVSHIAAVSSTAVSDSTFDAAYYAQQNPDVVAVYGTSAKALYSHYTTHGRAEGRKSHANDISHIAAVGSTAAAGSAAANSTFDAAYYAQQNPDVVAVYGTNASALYSHYTTHGRAEGRKSHANDISHMAVISSAPAPAPSVTTPVDTSFDANYYAQQNPDVTAAVGTNSNALYGHYVSHGRAEGRRGHE